MRFEELRELILSLDLGEPGSKDRPPRDNVRAVQNALAQALEDEDFCLDIISLELEGALSARQAPGRVAFVPPFHRIDERGIFFRLFYWPPGKDAPPHEHTSWTVTAVFHHELTVTTYDWETAVKEKKLQQKNEFSAERGRAGHIYDNCIHRPSNPTERLATSVHIFNTNDGPMLEEICGGKVEGLADDMGPGRWPSEPVAFRRAVAANRQRILLMHADMLSRFRSERAQGLLRRVFESGDGLVKLVASMVMKPVDPVKSEAMFQELCAVEPEYRERAALVTLRS
ncbi:MAG TPA: hypothetical protein VFF73_17325 [Planctomycetota bacterium]|nr:hypothetical protein [Planctomycetota bacterium]